MSKLSFRARALDPCKPMPIYLAEELPDLPEYSAINRAVPQMPSGMEKEEESEHHLQRAICTGLIIPTPEVFAIDQDFYDKSYPPNYKMPRQLIHMQPLGLEQDIPDYDMDSADEVWMNSQARRLDLTPLKFEQMMDKLEKSSGQTVVTLNEAKALLKQDDEVSTAVYDYWLNKRLKTQHPLILSVKTENRSGTAANNPYLAFRRRTEKMQTRKNRKNDETSYEKMLKLRRDLSRAVTLLEMVKKREKNKREQLHLTIEVFEKRYQLRDFSGSLMSELSSSIKSSRPAFAPIYPNQYSHHSSATQSANLLSSSSGSSQQQQQQQQQHHHHYSTSTYHPSGISVASTTGSTATKRDLDTGSRKEKRQYKKRKHKYPREKHYTAPNVASPAAVESTISSEDEDLAGSHLMGSEGEDEGLYAFRRNKNCEYQRPLTNGYGNWPWESKDESGSGLADVKYRFTLTSVREPRPRCIGFARRRVGRGGRVILDRISTNADDMWSQLDYTIFDSRTTQKSQTVKRPVTDDDISRDSKFISSSVNPITNPPSTTTSTECNVKSETTGSLDKIRVRDQSIYNNSYSDLCSRLYSDYDGSYRRRRFLNRRSYRKLSSITQYVKEIKQETPDEMMDVSGGDHWATPLDQRDSGIVVDLVRTPCINSISNRNISGNNNVYASGYSSSSGGGGESSSAARNLFNKRNETNISNVIKDEYTSTVIKKELDTDVNNSDEENVDLASLSSKLHASRDTAASNSIGTVVGRLDAMKSDVGQIITHSNYVELNTNTRLWHDEQKPETIVSSTLDPKLGAVDVKEQPEDTDSIYKEFLDEIQKNWLHFRPKTPPPPSPVAEKKSLEDEVKLSSVSFSEQTPIAIELQRIDSGSTPPQSPAPPSSVFTSKFDLDPMFITSEFSYNDLGGDEQLLFSNTTTDSSNSGIDFNISGDSLNELNLSLGEDENEKMLENILEECQIDDLKTLNQTTTFWDGILEDGGLLDVIDDKKAIIPGASKAVDLLVNGAESALLGEKDESKRCTSKHKGGLPKFKLGCSQFSVTNTSQDEKFFTKDEPAPANMAMKCEPPEELLETPQSSQQRNNQTLATVSVPGVTTIVAGMNHPSIAGPINNRQATIVGNNNPPIKVFIKQETPAPIVTNTPTPIVTKINQVPINQLNASSQVVTITSNEEVQNHTATMISNMLRDVIASGTQTIGSTVVTGTTATGIGTISNNHLNVSSSSTANIPSLLMSSIQQQSQTAVHQLSAQHQPQQHIIFRQIKQSSQSPHQQQQQMQNAGGIVSTTTSSYTTDGSGAIVIATSTTSPTKRQTNGPTDKNAIQTFLKQRYANRRLNLRQDSFEAVLAQPQQKQQPQQQSQQQQHLIKIPQIPVIVPDLNFQQQNQQQGGQQQSQQHQQNALSTSAAVAVAANHNYSLHPTAQPITIIGHQQQSGNKIILNTSGAPGTVGSGTNFTITTPIQDLPTKIQYGQMPSSNIKVNLVTSAGIQQGSLIMDAKNSEMVKTSLQQHQQAQITVATGQQQAQTLQHPARKAMFIDPDQKRVLCKLVNLSSLQPKNSAGQAVQVSSAAAAHLFSKAQTVQRLGNSAFVANVRTLVNNQVMGTSANTVATAGTANVNPMVQAAATAGLIAGSVGDITTTHKTQTANSGGGGAGNGGSDPGANVVSSGINLNTTNR